MRIYFLNGEHYNEYQRNWYKVSETIFTNPCDRKKGQLLVNIDEVVPNWNKITSQLLIFLFYYYFHSCWWNFFITIFLFIYIFFTNPSNCRTRPYFTFMFQIENIGYISWFIIGRLKTSLHHLYPMKLSFQQFWFLVQIWFKIG